MKCQVRHDGFVGCYDCLGCNTHWMFIHGGYFIAESDESCDVCNIEVNEHELESEGRLFSTYHLANYTKIYVITEWDRSVIIAFLAGGY